MALPTLPPPVDLSPETKKAVIDGLKKVIETLQANAIISASWTYQDVIHEPEILRAFTSAYRQNRAIADEIVVGADGQPVRDDLTPLVCGVTLEQVQQLLVKTCAKWYFERDRGEEETITETRTTKRFIFFTKTEQIERKATVTSDDRKVREILAVLAWDWQLDLLPAYKDSLNYQQVAEVGEFLINLRTPEAIHELAAFDAATIKKAKGLADKDFANVLWHRPSAVGGIAVWNKDMYTFYRNVLQDKAWDFFSREKSFYNVVADLDKATARIYGDLLCYIADENLRELQRLNIDKVDVLIQGLRNGLGPTLPQVMAIPAFAKDVLRKLVESLLHMTQEKEVLATSCQLTCKAIAPNVAEWLSRQRAG